MLSENKNIMYDHSSSVTDGDLSLNTSSSDLLDVLVALSLSSFS